VPADYVNKLAEKIGDEPESAATQPTYNASRLPKEPEKSLDEQLPIIGPSPKATIDYQSGKRRKNHI
jgi:hypothetical protein